MCCCAWQSRISLKKNFCPKNGENRPKVRFFGFVGKFSHLFLLSLVYKECSYYLLYSCTNLILWKNLVPDIWAKMLSANQIAGFLNWLYLQNTKMKKPDEKAWGKNLKLVEKYWVSMVKNGCGNSGLRTLKLAVSQKGINRINWFLVCW